MISRNGTPVPCKVIPQPHSRFNLFPEPSLCLTPDKPPIAFPLPPSPTQARPDHGLDLTPDLNSASKRSNVKKSEPIANVEVPRSKKHLNKRQAVPKRDHVSKDNGEEFILENQLRDGCQLSEPVLNSALQIAVKMKELREVEFNVKESVDHKLKNSPQTRKIIASLASNALNVPADEVQFINPHPLDFSTSKCLKEASKQKIMKMKNMKPPPKPKDLELDVQELFPANFITEPIIPPSELTLPWSVQAQPASSLDSISDLYYCLNQWEQT